MTWAPGQRLGPYQIDALIGQGSMGEVYSAYDSRLNRRVAVKRIVAGSLERFPTEARAIAALNHPHICQIFDVGPDYLVLEYVEGKPLKGPIASDEAVRLSLQIADALAAAHARGIIHRDLKPANVMVRGQAGTSTVKLLDFGVASFVDADADPDATGTAAADVSGTPAYMSPEQAQGKPLDARSDIFSFGAVLYELLGGTRPFSGDSVAGVLSAVLRDDPAPLDVPTSLRDIVARCLAKDPERRFQTVDALLAALRQATHLSGGARASIAVLPFANLGAEPENEYFGDGLAEEIINALAHVDGLKVIARTSAFSFKGKPQDVRQIAQALDVGHVLEGSVRRSGNRVRVTAQLVAADDGAHVWSERFDRPMTDVFAMQDEMAGAITTALKGRLGVAAPNARQHVVPKLEAYESYLSGRTHLNQFTPEAWSRAKADFERAMRADPTYAKPHAELALGYFIRGMHGMQPMREVAPLVRAGATRAIELDPTDPEPRFVLGAIALVHDYQWEEAGEHFAASMSGPHVPGHARWIYASLYLAGLGKFEESVAEMARAAEQDPLNATWHAIWAGHLLRTHPQRAFEVALRSVDIDSTYFLTHHFVGEAAWAIGRRDEAIAAWERAHALAPWFTITNGWLAAAYRLAGRDERADSLLATMGPTARPLWGRVTYHLLVSELAAAADWYERMIEERDPFALIYASDHYTAALRAHPRWRRLSELIGLKGQP